MRAWVVLRIGSHHQNNTMEFSNTCLFLLFNLLLLSSIVIGDHVYSDSLSNYNDVLRLVPKGPNPRESPPLKNILRLVPKGPNPKESPETPPLSKALYDSFEYKTSDSPSNHDEVLRLVPKGPNPPESPPLNVLRLVPTGPNPEQSPETPSPPPLSDSLYNYGDILRLVPKGPNPRESPPLAVLQTVPTGPNPTQSPDTPPLIR